MNQEEVHRLMMEAIDGEIDDAGRRQLEAMLESSSELRREYESMKALNQAQQEMQLIEPTQQAWQRFEKSLIAKLVYTPLHVGGMVLVILGMLCLFGFGVYALSLALWGDDQIPTIVRIGGSAVVAGVLALFASVLIHRLVTLPVDKYTNEVEL